MKKKFIGKKCYLCGIRDADSWDHVPPKNLFPNDYQLKGYKLPCCKECNNKYAKDEEYVRDRFSIAGFDPVARKVFKEKVQPSYLRPYSAFQFETKLDRILKDLTKIDIKRGEIYLGSATAIKFKEDRVKRVIDKITRGLYFAFTDKRIPDDYKVEVYFQPKDFLPNYLEKKTPFIGLFGDVFAYKGVLAKQDQFTGIIWMSFYRTLASVSLIISSKMYDEIEAKKSNPQI